MIKFRGKSSDEGEWIYGDLVHCWEGNRNCPTSIAVIGCYPDDVIPETVGQLIEVMKDGTEIYEGDILSIEDMNGERYESEVAQYGQIDVNGDNFDHTLLKWCDEFVDDYKIIGNIHDRGDSD